MVEISASVYDNGGVGDGDLSETVDFPFSSSADPDTFRVTQMSWYNSLGEQISVDNNGSETNGTPGVPDVVLGSTYDAAGNRLTLSATIGGTADFVNGYSYDDLNREYQVTQSAGGGDAVDPKQVNFTYDMFNNLIGRTVSGPGAARMRARSVTPSTGRTWFWPSTATATSRTDTYGFRRWTRSWPTRTSRQGRRGGAERRSANDARQHALGVGRQPEHGSRRG